jgi:hypothetical protein
LDHVSVLFRVTTYTGCVCEQKKKSLKKSSARAYYANLIGPTIFFFLLLRSFSFGLRVRVRVNSFYVGTNIMEDKKS